MEAVHQAMGEQQQTSQARYYYTSATTGRCRLRLTNVRLPFSSAKNRGSMAWKDRRVSPARPVQTWGLHWQTAEMHTSKQQHVKMIIKLGMSDKPAGCSATDDTSSLACLWRVHTDPIPSSSCGSDVSHC